MAGSMRVSLRVAGILGLLAALQTGCQTQGTLPVVDPSSLFDPRVAEAPGPDLTEDATAVLSPRPGSRYPNLYTSTSFAVLLSPDLLLARLRADAEAYSFPPAQVEFEADRIRNLAAQFLICEVHLVSEFGDVGIANDAVALRNMRMILGDDSGRRVTSAAVQLGGSEEIDYGGKIRIRRTSILLFPKAPSPGAPDLIQPITQGLHLTLSGQGSTFGADWTLNPSFQP